MSQHANSKAGTALDCPRQAEAMLNGLQNLRSV